MQRINVGLGVFVNDDGGDDDGPALVGCADAVDGKAAGETGDGAKEGFKGFGEVVRDEVLVYLYVSVWSA